MQKRLGRTTVTVPVPDHEELKSVRCWGSSGSLACLANSLK